MKKIQLGFATLIVLLPLVSKAGSLTISGISSGGFMASQMGVIYSDKISGIATVAGGVYYCAQNTYQENLKEYGTTSFFSYGVSAEVINAGMQFFSIKPKFKFTELNRMMTPLPSNPMHQAIGVCMTHPENAHGSKVDKEGKSSLMNLSFLLHLERGVYIAPLENIKRQKVLIYQGSDDHVVAPPMAGKIEEFYRRLGVKGDSLKMLGGKGAGHNFPTINEVGDTCSSAKFPYIANCNHDLAGDILKHLLRRNLHRAEAVENHLYRVDQLDAPQSIASYGYLYVNDYCLKNPSECDLHVALHGCEMSDSYDENFDKLYRSKVQLTKILKVKEYEMRARVPKMGARIFAMQSGYIEYAEDPKNRLMVYFPQTQITKENFPGNPKGCWDWYGWTDKKYATNRGPEPSWLIKQIQKVRQNPLSLIDGANL